MIPSHFQHVSFTMPLYGPCLQHNFSSMLKAQPPKQTVVCMVSQGRVARVRSGKTQRLPARPQYCSSTPRSKMSLHVDKDGKGCNHVYLDQTIARGPPCCC